MRSVVPEQDNFPKADGRPSVGVQEIRRCKTDRASPTHGLPSGDGDWPDRRHEETLEMQYLRGHTQIRSHPERSGLTDGVPVRQKTQAPGRRQQRVFPFFFIRIYGINYIHEENNGNSNLTGELGNRANLESCHRQARDIRKLVRVSRREGEWHPEV